MGRFFASILLLAACGDNVDVGGGPHDPGGTNTGGELTPLPHTTPEVCGFAQWTTVLDADPALQTSIVRRPSPGGAFGATILSVPRAGGTMTGFAVDDRMDMTTDPSGTKILVDETFSSVSASIVNNRLLATAVEDGSVRVDTLNDDLTNPQQIAKLPGTFIAQPAFFNADGATVVPVGGDDGLRVTEFDANWSIISSQLLGPSDPITGLAATAYGNAVLTAWSTTSHECYIEMFAALVPGPQSHTSFACDAPRIAADVVEGTAKIVFEGGGNVRLMHVAHTQMGGDSVLLRQGTSPRVVYDGSRYWVSYIDDRGDIVVGYLDGNNELVSMGLVGTRPAHDAYELTMIDNHPWILSSDPSNGYMAQRLCLATSF